MWGSPRCLIALARTGLASGRQMPLSPYLLYKKAMVCRLPGTPLAVVLSEVQGASRGALAGRVWCVQYVCAVVVGRYAPCWGRRLACVEIGACALATAGGALAAVLATWTQPTGFLRARPHRPCSSRQLPTSCSCWGTISAYLAATGTPACHALPQGPGETVPLEGCTAC